MTKPSTALAVARERVRMPVAMAITGKSARVLQSMALKQLIPGACKIGGEWTFNEKRLRAWVRGEPDQLHKPSLKNAALYEDCEIPSLEYGHDGFVYVLGYHQYVKIGWTISFRNRFTTLQGSTPETLFIYKIMSAKRERELELQERFRPALIRGEWFWLNGPIAQWIGAGYPL